MSQGATLGPPCLILYCLAVAILFHRGHQRIPVLPILLPLSLAGDSASKVKFYLTELWPGLEELTFGINGVKDTLQSQAVVAHAFNPRTHEAGAGGSL